MLQAWGLLNPALSSLKNDFPLPALVGPAATLTWSRARARPLRAFGFAKLLSQFPKRLMSPTPASEGHERGRIISVGLRSGQLKLSTLDPACCLLTADNSP